MDELRPQTSAVNGPLWGSRARDWADIQEATAQPAFEALLARTGVGQGCAYLDVGCGAGMAVAIAAARGAQVAGIDAAEPLLAIARERVPDGDFRVADLEALPFADASFDVVTAFNAIQYAASPLAAMIEARRVTREGGIVAVMAWGDPAKMAMASVITALGPLLPPPPPGAAGPFALSDDVALRALVRDAGLETEEMFDLIAPVLYPDLATALRGLNSSGVAARAMGIAGEEAVTQAHSDALSRFRGEGGDYVIGAAFRCLIARVPAA